jgi:predicted AlkP superfamily phosphohydrolase/phosphomutase
LKEIKDPDTGERIIGEIYRCEEIYHGKHLREAPDISFLPRDMSYKALGTLAFMSSEFIRDSYGLSGDHRMNGILMCSGRGIKRGKIEGANIVDLAPTILYIMGEKIPEDMDGRVLTEIFTEEHLGANPIEFAEGEWEQVGGFGCSPEDMEEIKARLRALGYV